MEVQIANPIYDNVKEEDFPEKFRPIIRRLKSAASVKITNHVGVRLDLVPYKT